MKVKCINVLPIDRSDPTYPPLILYNIYTVIEPAEWYRIISTIGSPILCDPRRFEIIDNSIDDDWIEHEDEGFKGYINPVFWDGPFFEKYFDHDLETIVKFNKYIIKKFQKTIGVLEAITTHPRKKQIKVSH